MAQAFVNPPQWGTAVTQELVSKIAQQTANETPSAVQSRIEALAHESHQIHDVRGINLNPATNLLNPRAEAILASGMSSRPSLGHPGNKYETGLQAIQEIEVTTAELACEVFRSRYAEFRVASGSIANLYAFMALCEPGDTIVAPPASIGGHVTHHGAGSAGMFRLKTVAAPINPQRYTVDIDALRDVVQASRPKVITIGGSLNLFEHPVAQVREIADSVGAWVMFDAAHQCGLIAGNAWANPLELGAHVMTMSTYKSLGGPAGGLICTNDSQLAQRLDEIAHPGLTANFDAAKIAALGITLADWKAVGADYARDMIETAQVLASELHKQSVPVFAKDQGFTMSHQFAVLAAQYGGGQEAARTLEASGLLACGIGLPVDDVPGDLSGLRIGTPELVRMGMTVHDMPELAELIARSLSGQIVAGEVSQMRSRFRTVHYTTNSL
jgi:glycine hydroxymethyltransferase